MVFSDFGLFTWTLKGLMMLSKNALSSTHNCSKDLKISSLRGSAKQSCIASVWSQPFRKCLAPVALSLLLFFSSCSQQRPHADTNVGAGKIYKGDLVVDADPGLEHVMKLQQEVFGYQHDSVNLHIQYRNEADMLTDFRTGKATMLVMTRPLDSSEIKSLIEKDTLYVREILVARDAVALIGNKSFNDSTLDMDALKKYFDPANNAANSPQMVFEDQHSSIVKLVLGKLGYKGKVSNHVYALKSTEEVLSSFFG